MGAKSMRTLGKLIWLLIALTAALLPVLAFSGLQPLRAYGLSNATKEAFLSHISDRIPALMKLYDIPGSSIALVLDGEVVWSGAYGYADIGGGRKLTTDTPMRVQSISKPVTAWGVMNLAEQGKIDLDNPITDYIRDFRFPGAAFSAERVTVRHLLSHTAGLPLGDVFTIYSPYDEIPSLEEKLMREAVFESEPGRSFSYSNTGYNLLELLIEEVSGRDFAQYMNEEILDPSGMKNAAFEWSEAIRPPVPNGYDLNGRPVPVYIYPEKGSGGLFATVEDIAAFVISGMPPYSGQKQTISTGAISELYTPVSENIGIYGLVFDAYGLGYYIETLPNGKLAVAHGGQGTGIMTHFHAVPETGDAFVILTNSQRSWPFIARLLSDWAQWRGFPSVGMGRMVLGEYGMWVLVGIIWFSLLLQVRRLAAGIMYGKRRAGIPSGKSGTIRYIQAGVAIALTAGLIWCACQKYLFITSVFPRVSVWLWGSVLAAAIILMISAVFQPDEMKHAGERDSNPHRSLTRFP